MNNTLFVSFQARNGNHTGFLSVEILREKAKAIKCLCKANY